MMGSEVLVHRPWLDISAPQWSSTSCPKCVAEESSSPTGEQAAEKEPRRVRIQDSPSKANPSDLLTPLRLLMVNPARHSSIDHSTDEVSNFRIQLHLNRTMSWESSISVSWGGIISYWHQTTASIAIIRFAGEGIRTSPFWILTGPFVASDTVSSIALCRFAELHSGTTE